MPMVMTHLSVDLDAVASLWAFLKFAQVAQYPAQWAHRFVPAGWTGAKNHKGVPFAFDPRYDVALDIQLEGHGINGFGDGETKNSAFHLVVDRFCRPEDKELLKPLVEWVDIQDSTGSAVGTLLKHEEDTFDTRVSGHTKELLLSFNLTSVFHCLKRSLGFKADDRIFEAMSVIFEGFYKSREEHAKNKRDADRAVWKKACLLDEEIRVAIAPEGTFCGGVLKDQGADFIVWSNGKNLGISRKHGCKHSACPGNVRHMVKDFHEEEHWYFHAEEFTCSHGSTRSPTEHTSQITPEMLASALLAQFG